MYFNLDQYREKLTSELVQKLLEANERLIRAKDEIASISAVLMEREHDLSLLRKKQEEADSR